MHTILFVDSGSPRLFKNDQFKTESNICSADNQSRCRSTVKCWKKYADAISLKILLCYVVFGLLMVAFFSGKSRVDIESIAVSPNEQYVACFETGNGHKIHCFHSDGSLAFTYNISADISSGGHCTLWFEDDFLCALFYRTDKILYFTLDGSILNIADNTAEESPPKFPSFTRRHHQYVFDGNEIDVVYDEGSFLGYWLFGSERYLAITLKSGETKIVYTWTAKEGIAEKME